METEVCDFDSIVDLLQYVVLTFDDPPEKVIREITTRRGIGSWMKFVLLLIDYFILRTSSTLSEKSGSRGVLLVC